MNITVKDKDIELKFGMKFIREMDEACQKTWAEGMTDKFGLSVGIGVPLMMAGNPVILSDFLYYGTNWMTSGRPKQSDIDDFIDNVDDLDKVYNEVLEELKKSNACGKQAKDAEEAMQAELERQKAPRRSTTR